MRRLSKRLCLLYKEFSFLTNKKTKQKSMKKFAIKPQFAIAFIFAGVFADTEKAIEAYAPGSGAVNAANITETTVENETGTVSTLTFNDANGTTQTAMIGDALVVATNTDGSIATNTDGSLKGYLLVLAADQKGQDWTDTGDTVAPFGAVSTQ